MKFYRSYKVYAQGHGAHTVRVVHLRTHLVLIATIIVAIGCITYAQIANSVNEPLLSNRSKPQQIQKFTNRFTPENLRRTLSTRQSNSGVGTTTASGQTMPIASHTVTTTVFWVGEAAGPENGYIANAASAWDESWQTHYGGIDSDTARNGYMPAGFTPKENPFYFALPYNDFTTASTRKSTANLCPNAQALTALPYSWCKNSWIKIESHGKTAYAQWQDVGPFEEDDIAYVFGSAAPKNKINAQAGLDVSPAVRDYLGLADIDKTSWQFVTSSAVPAGPWKSIVTTSLGDSL